MTTEFGGFPKEGLDFLGQLGSADKAWFDDHRKMYASTVVEPTRAFVVALGSRLNAEISPTIVAEPKTNRSIGPINNDLRFSPDKSPYKDHVLLRFWDGPDKKTAPTVMVRIAPDETGFSCGTAIGSVDRWRSLVDDNTTGAALTNAIDQLGKDRDLDVFGVQLKRVPKPYLEDHPRADLLLHTKAFAVRWIEPAPELITTPEFVDYCLDLLRPCADLHHWLVHSL